MSHRRRLAVAALAVLSACAGGSGERAAVTTAPGSAPPSTTRQTLPPATEVGCPLPPPRAEAALDRPRYEIGIFADPDRGIVEGTQRVAFTPDLPTAELVFRLWPNGPRPAAAGASLETGPVAVDGAPAPHSSPDATTLVVDLGGTLPAGETVDVALEWVLRLPGPANDRLSNDQDSLRMGSFFPILAWEPGVGWAREQAVGGFAEASMSPVADFDLTVDVPDGYDVLASGVPTPRGSTHYVAAGMRDVAVSVGRFDDLVSGTAQAPGPVEVTVGVHSGTPAQAQPYLEQVVAALESFAARYGDYPWPVFTLAVTPGLGGGIEYPSHVMQGPFTLGNTTSHEVAHMWFYGLVGNNQGRDPWLDEGLTSWAEARHEGEVDRFLARPIPPVAQDRLGEPMSFWEENHLAYVEGVYVQGVHALHQLGPPELVDCALRVYVAQNAHRIATPADLVAAATAVFPDARATLAQFGVSP